MVVTLMVETDHFQVLIGDAVNGPLSDTAQLWDSGKEVSSSPDLPHIVAIGTARYGGATCVEVQLANAATAPFGWDTLGSFSIEIPSGELVFWGPETRIFENAPRMSVARGSYLGEAYSCRANEIADEEARQGPDRYRIVLWPASRTKA